MSGEMCLYWSLHSLTVSRGGGLSAYMLLDAASTNPGCPVSRMLFAFVKFDFCAREFFEDVADPVFDEVPDFFKCVCVMGYRSDPVGQGD